MTDTSTAVIGVDSLVNTHTHLREGMELMGPLIEKGIEGGADVMLPMPNTKDGLRTVQEVTNYISALKALVPEGKCVHFIPTMLLTEETSVDELGKAVNHGIFDVKVYPLERTTNSHWGVRHYGRIIDKVRECGKLGIRVHFHPEHPWKVFSNRDAEFVFLPIADMFLSETEAKIFWEHGTDGRCIPFWIDMAKSRRFYVTLTAHHLASNEDQAFGDVRQVCKPSLKTEQDRNDLVLLVKDDHPWVLAGPDDAPHPIQAKHVHQGRCACGAYTSPFLLPLYAHALGLGQKDGTSRDVFVNFTSRNARAIFGNLPTPRKVELIRKPFRIPSLYTVGPWTVEPFWAGQEIDWTLLNS